MIDSIPVRQVPMLGGGVAEVLDLPPEYRQSPGYYSGWIPSAAGPLRTSWARDGQVWDHWTERNEPDDGRNLILDD